MPTSVHADRRPLVAGNWKMHCTRTAAAALAGAVAEAWSAASGVHSVDLLVAPPFTALGTVHDVLAGTPVHVGAQNMHWASHGAFTGEVSPSMVRELATHVILGHSERRTQFGETDADVRRKLEAAIAHDLVGIVCVGETELQRDSGTADAVVAGQVRAAFAGLAPEVVAGLVVAYEPVWAIGTGKACHPDEAERVADAIRAAVAELAGQASAARVRILYGGSVNAANAADYLQRAGIDGALVGGAALKVESFMAIAAAATAGA